MSRQDHLPRLYPHARGQDLLVLLGEIEVVLLSAVYWQEEASWVVASRQLNDLMLLAPTVGAIEATVAEETYRVDASSVLIVAEGARHSLRPAPGVARIEQVALHCHLVSQWRTTVRGLFRQPVHRLAHPAAWHDRWRRLVHAMNRPDLGQQYGAIVIRELFAELIFAGADLQPRTPDMDPRIARAADRLHREYAKPLTVAQLAAQARLSTVQFRKLFQRDLHAPPKTYLLQHRLRVASQLLRTTALNVQEIAFQTGFNSEAYFHRCFRQAHGCTPLDYRAGRHTVV